MLEAINNSIENPPFKGVARSDEGSNATKPPHCVAEPLNRGIKSERQNPPFKGVARSDEGSLAQNNLSPFGRFNYNPKLNDRAKLMGKEMTRAEKNVWFKLLSKKKLDGYKFIKQKIVHNYILDFYCSELLLAIEIDGETHDLEYDKVRDDFVSHLGITTIRFSNEDAFNNLEGIRIQLLEFIKTKLPH